MGNCRDFALPIFHWRLTRGCLEPLKCFLAGEYTAERLNALKKNAISFPATKPEKERTAGSPSQAPFFKVAGSFKRAGAQTDDSSRFEYSVTGQVSC